MYSFHYQIAILLFYCHTNIGAGGFHNEHCDNENHYVCKKQSGTTQPIHPKTAKEPLDTFYCPVGYTAIDPRQEPNMGTYCAAPVTTQRL